MIAPICKHEKLSKHGKDRKGQQRWKCGCCGITVVRDEHVRPLGDMRLEFSKAVQVLKMLLEGMSIRAAERITGVNKDTICDLVLHVGQNADRFMLETVRNVEAKTIEMDEIWGFVGCKARTATIKAHGPEMGDAWTWLAIDADTKLILANATGKRDESTASRFLSRLNNATIGRCQVTSDGLGLYTHSVPLAMGSRVDFAQLVKSYKSTQVENRYSPAAISGIEKTVRFGQPDEAKISTSYSERYNLSVRMHNRRMTRLTNAHSKKPQHHSAMMNLWIAFYNFCRKHETLKGVSPAMAAKLTEKVWTLEELLRQMVK